MDSDQACTLWETSFDVKLIQSAVRGCPETKSLKDNILWYAMGKTKKRNCWIVSLVSCF